ncbi:hypothetical protein NOF55_21110 [Rhizobiaceae bacterium BDR2-2]|uniref:Uncharacterized protein n=1 Tax=Ectorhizobium quercum TaxID=2965071 RepID=A0AAE3SXY8_9HYPH|nr:hypothetical protein [Ectorhizobium quercum]MCX8999609.1 hypothetical protein [Ectorhizobium quercum]
MTITKEAFFKPGRTSAQDKASTTDRAAKEIITAEALQRARKTQRLRELREAQETATVVIPPVRGKKPSSSGKT